MEDAALVGVFNRFSDGLDGLDVTGCAPGG